MSSKVANPGERPVQQQGVVVDMHHVNKPGVIFPLYFVNKKLTNQKTQEVQKTVNYGRCPETMFRGVY